MVRPTRTSTSSVPQPPSSSSSTTFDDEENFIISVLISMHEEILGNTASAGPAVDAKNKTWNLISDRLCNKLGGVYRTDEQVKARWRSMRSVYSFKTDKARHIAEVFYKKIQGTSHGVRVSDVTVSNIKFPQWLNNLIKTDSIMKSKPQESSQQQQQREQTNSSSKRGTSKRSSPPAEKEASASTDRGPERKRSRPLRTCSTMPQLVSQFPPSELSAIRGTTRSVKREREKSPISSTSPTSAIAPEELNSLNSVTESGNNSPLPSSAVFWEETDYEIRRRREEELHQAKLNLLRSQTKEADAKTQLTKLQIEVFRRGETTTIPATITTASPLLASSDTVVSDSPIEITPSSDLLETSNNQTTKA